MFAAFVDIQFVRFRDTIAIQLLKTEIEIELSDPQSANCKIKFGFRIERNKL